MVGAGVALCLAAAPAGMLFGGNSPVAFASSGGDNNKGDTWVDNVGQPSGPGHEMDPHLACADINVWGDKMADASGSYTVDGWPPSGSQEQDYPKSGHATWTYNRSTGGSQIMDVISVGKLIANAKANGDAPINKQGFHFKLQFSQDPQKHKTFWVNCPEPSPTPTPTPHPTPSPSPTPSPTPSPSPTPGPTSAVELSKSVSPSGNVASGTLLTYTITLENTGSHAVSNVTVDDTMSGNADFTVNDGTGGTSNSFVGMPSVTVTKVSDGHYRWTYASVAHNATDSVTYTAVIRTGSASTAVNGVFTLVDTAASPKTNCASAGVAACTTTNTVTEPTGGVQGISASTPSTGILGDIRFAITGFLLLGGLGLMLVGLLVKRPELSAQIRS